MRFKYVLSPWINYSSVKWERCCVMLRGCRHTAAVNPPSQRKHTCNLSDLTVADRERDGVRGVYVCVCLSVSMCCVCVGGVTHCIKKE